MVTYNYIKEKKYLSAVFSNKVNQGQIVNYIGSVMKEDNLPKDLRVVIDARAGSMNINPANLYYILDENLKMFSKFNTLRVAVVVNDSINKALAVLYTRLIQLERYECNVFTSLDQAEEWITTDISEIKTYPNEVFANNTL